MTPDEGTRKECRKVGSMDCNFSATFINVRSKNYSSTRSVDYIFILSSTLVVTTGTGCDLSRKVKVTAYKGDTCRAVNL